MDKVYSIVVTYNGIDWIDKCLTSLKNSTIPTSIVVVDNCSEDGTIEHIRQKYPSVHLIPSKINLGFGKGNNIGLKKAVDEDADYVFLLNQDAWIEKDTIEKTIMAHRNNSEYGIISPLHQGYNGSDLEYYFSTIINPFDCPDLISHLYTSKLSELYEIAYVHAACWLVSRNCLKEVGGFDPIFYHYGEDNDYISRARAKGFRIGICPGAKVNHEGTHEGLKAGRDLKSELNFIIIKLKDIRSRLRGLVLVHIKTSVDNMTSALLYRRFNDFGFQFRLFFKSIFLIRKIRRARKTCKAPLSYLNGS